VIQWDTRTSAECRERTVVAGAAEIDVGIHTESAIARLYQFVRGLGLKSAAFP
jgi:hypothetical protein